jgi:hypothetical protein
MSDAIRRSAFAALALLGFACGAAAADAPAVAGAWARATPPGAQAGAVYLTLRGGATADRLTGASTTRAPMAHLHSVEDAAGMMKMRAVDGIDVPAGATVRLTPNGLHLMLMGLEKPLAAGERFTLTLHFAKGGDRSTEVEVRAATAPEPSPHDHH